MLFSDSLPVYTFCPFCFIARHRLISFGFSITSASIITERTLVVFLCIWFRKIGTTKTNVNYLKTNIPHKKLTTTIYDEISLLSRPGKALKIEKYTQYYQTIKFELITKYKVNNLKRKFILKKSFYVGLP